MYGGFIQRTQEQEDSLSERRLEDHEKNVREDLGAEMAQQIEELAAKPGTPSLTPEPVWTELIC